MTERELLAKGYRKYQGENIDIYFHKDICQHSGNCTAGDSEVFQVERRPWILPLEDHVEQIKQTIHKCPSGALKYRLPGEDKIFPE